MRKSTRSGSRPDRLASSMYVSALTALVLLFSVISSTAAGAPSAAVAQNACKKYANSPQHGICQQLLAQLTQELPSAGPATVTGSTATGILHSLNSRAAGAENQLMNTARTKAGQQPADQQEPWYNHGQAYYHDKHMHGQDSPHDQDSYYGQQPYSGHAGAGSGYGSTPYPQDPPTPDVPLKAVNEIFLIVFLEPKPSAVNATGRLTQNAFESWRVDMFRTVTVGEGKQKLKVDQNFGCSPKAPVVFEFEGTVQEPTSLKIQCKAVPFAGAIVALGPKFPWKQSLKPRYTITVPNPTELVYVVDQPSQPFASVYLAPVSSIKSPTAFQGSAVELLTDALLALPKQFDFEVTAKPFAEVDDNRDGNRAPDVSLPKWAASHLSCDKVTSAAEKVLCERREKFARVLRPGSPRDAAAHTEPLQSPAASTAATASSQYRRHPNTPPVNRDYRENDVPEEAYPPRPYDKVVEGDAYGPESPYAVGHHPDRDGSNIVLIPQTLTTLDAYVKPTDLSINATGDLTQDDFKASSVLMDVSAYLSDEVDSFSEAALSVRQSFQCVPPVSWHFSGLVRGPERGDPFPQDYIRIQCKMELYDSTIVAGVDFPWNEAQEERYKLQIAQPQTARYLVDYQESFDATFNTRVPYMRSGISFTGSIIDYMTQALLGKPAEFDFDTYLTRPRRNCGLC